MNSPQFPSAPVAVIDIGSNSIKVLVAKRDPVSGALLSVYEQTAETRISKGISGTPPVLLPQSIAAGVASVRNLWQQAQRHQPARTAIVATSAVRSASNGQQFLTAIEAAVGTRPLILSGDQEAEAIGLGVKTDPQLQEIVANSSLFDLGGGSLELIRFDEGQQAQRVSLPLGVVRLTERFIKNPMLPVRESVQLDIAEHIRDTISASGFQFSQPLIGCSGGLSIIRRRIAMDSGRPWLETSPILYRAYLEDLCERVCRQTFEERVRLSRLPEERADVFPAAFLCYQSILHMADTYHIYHSPRNLRFGMAAKLTIGRPA